MSQKPNKRRVSGGRVTPKGTRPEGYTPETAGDPRLHDGSTVTEVIAIERGLGKYDSNQI